MPRMANKRKTLVPPHQPPHQQLDCSTSITSESVIPASTPPTHLALSVRGTFRRIELRRCLPPPCRNHIPVSPFSAAAAVYVVPAAATAVASGTTYTYPTAGFSDDTSSAMQEPRHHDRGWRPELEHNLAAKNGYTPPPGSIYIYMNHITIFRHEPQVAKFVPYSLRLGSCDKNSDGSFAGKTREQASKQASQRRLSMRASVRAEK